MEILQECRHKWVNKPPIKATPVLVDVLHQRCSERRGEPQPLQERNALTRAKVLAHSCLQGMRGARALSSTERPYGCDHCSARFTLRSNMERHIKQQHPEHWASKPRGGRRNSAMAAPVLAPHLRPPPVTMASALQIGQEEEEASMEDQARSFKDFITGDFYQLYGVYETR